MFASTVGLPVLTPVANSVPITTTPVLALSNSAKTAVDIPKFQYDKTMEAATDLESMDSHRVDAGVHATVKPVKQLPGVSYRHFGNQFLRTGNQASDFLSVKSPNNFKESFQSSAVWILCPFSKLDSNSVHGLQHREPQVGLYFLF
jgi:hypothetical protein